MVDDDANVSQKHRIKLPSAYPFSSFTSGPSLDRAIVRRSDTIKLVISGVPCCGKTRFGDWLRDHEQFTHVNLEPRHSARGSATPPQITPSLVPWVATLAHRTVVTWGFKPCSDAFEVLSVFREFGFTLWWFDGDYETSRRRYIERDGEAAAIEIFDRQKKRLVKAAPTLQRFYGGHRLRTLTPSGLMQFPHVFDHVQRKSRR